MVPEKPMPPYLNLTDALAAFASFADKTQSLGHIRPLHQHIALRLVLEGGFLPDEILPHPPIRAIQSRNEWLLEYAPAEENSSEQTVLGGLKSKKIDVVVSKSGVGPVLAISVKGTTGAFRNLTNRMEEAIGDSTNVHLMYPGLVYGFFQILRANRKGDANVAANDVAVDSTNQVVESVSRYHDALAELSGRRFVRDDITRYERVAFALVDTDAGNPGGILREFPPSESPLRPERFFADLFACYDLRFPYVGASLPNLKRVVWSDRSPFLKDLGEETEWKSKLGFRPRIA